MLQPSQQAQLLQHRSAFSLYLKEGIEAVKKYHPGSVAFVTEHKDKSLQEVTELLTRELDATDYLTSTEANKKRLDDAIESDKRGEGVKVNPEDIDNGG